MDAFAIVRPDDWNFALFLHVLGAMVMVGALVLALGYLAAAWRGDSPTRCASASACCSTAPSRAFW